MPSLARDHDLDNLRETVVSRLPGHAHHGVRRAYTEFRRRAGHVRPDGVWWDGAGSGGGIAFPEFVQG